MKLHQLLTRTSIVPTVIQFVLKHIGRRPRNNRLTLAGDPHHDPHLGLLDQDLGLFLFSIALL